MQHSFKLRILCQNLLMTIQSRKYRFDRFTYYRMWEAGILPEENRFELIEGEIIEMSPINSPHAGMVNKLNRILTIALKEEALVCIQNPVVLSDFNEPEPDIVLAKPISHDYTKNHPKPEDIFCLFEVADSSLDYDREIKAALYAESKIPEFWIVNISEKQLERYTKPTDGQYSERTIYSFEEEAKSSVLNFALSNLF